MNSPFYSIIIPTYNSAKTLSACLESIVSQSFRDFEVLIIDGGSTDSTIPIVKHYNEVKGNICWISEKDNGIYDAMNKGIKMAKGEWLYFLGSDDYFYDKDVLRNVAQNLENSNAVFFYGNVLIKGDANWAKHNEVYAGKFLLQDLMVKNICHQAIFYNKTLIDKYSIRFRLQYPVCADWDFNLNCWSKGETNFMPIMIAVFSAGGESTKVNVSDNFGEDFLDHFIEYFQITSYRKLKKILVPKRIAQLGKRKKFRIQYKLDSCIRLFTK